MGHTVFDLGEFVTSNEISKLVGCGSQVSIAVFYFVFVILAIHWNYTNFGIGMQALHVSLE